MSSSPCQRSGDLPSSSSLIPGTSSLCTLAVDVQKFSALGAQGISSGEILITGPRPGLSEAPVVLSWQTSWDSLSGVEKCNEAEASRREEESLDEEDFLSAFAFSRERADR